MYMKQCISTFCETLCTSLTCLIFFWHISFLAELYCCFSSLEVWNYIEILEKTQKYLNMKILITLWYFEGQIYKCHFFFPVFFIIWFLLKLPQGQLSLGYYEGSAFSHLDVNSFHIASTWMVTGNLTTNTAGMAL